MLTCKAILIRMGENSTMTKIIVLSAIGLFLLICAYYFLIKPTLKLRKLNKEQEKQELKKKRRRTSWEKTHISPENYTRIKR